MRHKVLLVLILENTGDDSLTTTKDYLPLVSVTLSFAVACFSNSKLTWLYTSSVILMRLWPGIVCATFGGYHRQLLVPLVTQPTPPPYEKSIDNK